MIPQLHHHTHFLTRIGWVETQALTPDCGHRRYWRVQKAEQTAILVWDDQTLGRFLTIAAWLRDKNFAAPQVYEVQSPFALLEDFGTRSLRTLPQAKALPLAVDTLRALAAIPLDSPSLQREGLGEGQFAGNKEVGTFLSPFKGSRLHLGRADLLPSPAWAEIEAALPPMPHNIFVHGDFHPDNLMALADGQCGLLDFQDALRGPAAYDLVNLLEDARADVPPDLRKAMIDRYCAGMGREERKIFTAWYSVLKTGFHCRVLALFMRLGGSYAAHIPRLQKYIREAIHKDDLLRPLIPFLEKAGRSDKI